MRQKTLIRNLEKFASKKFSSTREMLNEILIKIVEDEEVNVTGGRIWKLDVAQKAYKLLLQEGKTAKLDEKFSIKIDEYPLFEKVSRERTILAQETNEMLRDKGIYFFSISGVGSKIKIGKKQYYQYLLALNSDVIDDELRYVLNIVATILTSKIRERKISQSRQYLIQDLDKARELQKSILPEHENRFYGYQMFGVTIPSEIIGGDYFDYLPIGYDEDRIGITVGDAASHGLSAAAEAMYISGAIRMASTFQLKISPMMFRLNNLINKIFSDDRFTSLFYGELSTDKKGLFLYANAGHNSPMLYKKRTGKILYLEPTGPLLGPAPNSRYETDSINIESGDILVIYTDGIVETANNLFEFYGENRLEEIILKNASLTPKEITYKILDDLNRFTTQDSKYQDDKTVVVIKRDDNNEF
ncbi:MAG: serine/threonine-protein phosphatase [Melioribacteraceae bacterium]|nr:serine/threonine-protein phosphatase [Melioribacteraceae bacterium]